MKPQKSYFVQSVIMRRAMSLALAFILFQTVSGQSRYGVKAGVNLADQEKSIHIPQGPNIDQDPDFFVGYQAGLFYKTKLHRQLWFATELNFSVIGSTMTLTNSNGDSYDAHEKLGYIEVPLLIEYQMHRFYLGAGPAVSLKLFSKITNFENSSFKFDTYQTIDASANLLAGYKVAEKVDVNLRYSYGLLNLYKNPGFSEARNRFVNLSVLYYLK